MVIKPIKGVTTMFSNYDDVLTVAEVAEVLYVGRNTIYELLNSGTLVGFRIGRGWRIPKANLEAYILKKCNASH